MRWFRRWRWERHKARLEAIVTSDEYRKGSARIKPSFTFKLTEKE